ncbi:hypothetical protein J437_LFUL004419 [Ladona fulva]|uniref:Cathepsin propeptide inhibitor domain-containing protein n=1 Tax=Ladona fulva TaxID=123851 RepID=A0A8K0JXC0_LADFU|nr:hypothetical protein J437_LFUL004419 [Ladona fulva]
MDWKNSLATVAFIVLCFVGIPLHVDINSRNETADLFETYIRKYNKTYRNNSLEYKRRYSNFQNSLKSIELMNSAKSSDIGAIYGLTKFSDLSPDEFLHNHLLPGLHERIAKRNYTDKNNLHSYKHRRHHTNHIHKRAVLPQKVDWRTKGIIGAIRNQKDCGGCWAFSTVETVESMNALKTGKIETLSVQQSKPLI